MTDQELQSLRNIGNECEAAADEITRLRAALAAAPQPARVALTEEKPSRADLLAAVQFYADRDHLVWSEESAWDTVSGEPQNWWCDEAGTATVEDGTLARMTLEGRMTAQHFAALKEGEDIGDAAGIPGTDGGAA